MNAARRKQGTRAADTGDNADNALCAPAEMRAALLLWYERSARDLPWRRTRDPYAIWVSEVMLQQTRVETVIPYYQRFLTRFSSAQALADAPLDDVLAHWSGLGYYRRARLLHEGAKVLVRDHGGVVPRAAEARLALPGVGRYTAGAIGSIAFDLPEPIVDGNVARVLTRVCGIDTPLGTPLTERALWREAEQLCRGERPGALNQALMELGARVCLPQNPRCAECPIAHLCYARREAVVDDLPVPAPKKAPREVALVGLLARSEGGELLLQRAAGNLFGGLWGLPLVEGRGVDQARALAGGLGVRGTLAPTPLGRATHVLTHRRLAVEVFALAAVRVATREDLRLVADSALDTLGVATLTRKLLALESASPG